MHQQISCSLFPPMSHAFMVTSHLLMLISHVFVYLKMQKRFHSKLQCGIYQILHTKRKVVEKSSNVLSPRQLYGCHSESCQSRQHWQLYLVLSKGCQNRHRQIDNLKVNIVVNMTPFWTLFDNLAFCVFASTLSTFLFVFIHIKVNLVVSNFKYADIKNHWAPPGGGPFMVCTCSFSLSPSVPEKSAHGVFGLWAAQEGPIELLLAKVKNSSGRIGIFTMSFDTEVSKLIKAT